MQGSIRAERNVRLPGREGSISWVDSSGKTEPLHAPPGQYYTPRFSPDDKRLGYAMGTGKGEDIWVNLIVAPKEKD